MTTLIIFLSLTLIEFILIWFKYQEIKDIKNFGEIVADTVGIKTGALDRLIKKLMTWKHLIWIPVGIILAINLIAAVVINIIITVILAFI